MRFKYPIVFWLLLQVCVFSRAPAQNFSTIINAGDTLSSTLTDLIIVENTLQVPTITIDYNSRLFTYDMEANKVGFKTYYEYDLFKKIRLDSHHYIAFGRNLSDPEALGVISLRLYTNTDSLLKEVYIQNIDYESTWPFDIERIGSRLHVGILLEKFTQSGRKDRDIGYQIFDLDLNLLHEDILNNHIELSYVWNMTQSTDSHLIMSIGAHFYDRFGRFPQVIKIDSLGNEVWRWNGQTALLHGAVNVRSAQLSNGNIVIGYRRETKEARDSTVYYGYATEVNTLVFLNSEGDSIGEKHLYFPKGENHIISGLKSGRGDYFFTCGTKQRRDEDGFYRRYGSVSKYNLKGDTIWTREFLHPTIGEGNNDTDVWYVLELENGDIAGVGRVDNLEVLQVFHNWAFSLDTDGCFNDNCMDDLFVSTDFPIHSPEIDVSIYPNPGHGAQAYYKTDEQVSRIVMYDQRGRLLRDIGEPDFNKIRIAGLLEGIYYIQFITNDGDKITKKFIKSNR